MPLISITAFLLLAAAAWLRGGSWVPMQGPLPWLGGLILVSILLAPAAGRESESPSTERRLRPCLRCFKDPVFYLGLAFLGLLCLQWWNAGRIRLEDPATGQWYYSAPRHPGWPSAVTHGEAAEMLRWFFPAGCLVVGLRAASLSRRDARRLLLALLLNTSVLALLGIAQVLSGTDAILWMIPARDFFATFGYTNHAAAFFLLMFAVAAGFFAHETLKALRGRRYSARTMIGSGVAGLLSFVATNVTRSRAGILLSWLLCMGVFLYVISAAWRRLRPAQRVNAVAAFLAVCCVAFFFVASSAEKAFYTRVNRIDLDTWREFDAREFQLAAAWQIFAEDPWFGVGGWGYRYFMAAHVDPDQRVHINEGKANVHCDPLQFLCEFGLTGFVLMTGVIGVLLFDCLRRPKTDRKPGSDSPATVVAHPLLMLPLAGAGLVLLHSLIDLPFRSPAVLYHWLAILCVLPAAAWGRQMRSTTDHGTTGVRHQKPSLTFWL